MKYFFPIFVSFILLSSFALMLIPNNTQAAETEYLPLVTYEDDTNGLFSESWSYFQIVDESGNKVIKDTRTGVGAAYQNADVPTLPDSFEASFNFKSMGVGSSGSGMFYVHETGSGTSSIGVSLGLNNFGYVVINAQNTTFYINDGNWHSIFINVTTAGGIFQTRISVDNSGLSAPYNCGYHNYDEYIVIGGLETTTSNLFFWDNIIVASRIGAIPNASFEYTPDSGDGLTNFVFSDTSSIDNPLFPVSYYWSFGDGNYSRDQNCNHTYIHEGVYEVSLTVGNRFGSDTAYSNITVSAIPSGGGGGTSSWLYTLFPGFIILIMVIIVMRIVFNERMER